MSKFLKHVTIAALSLTLAGTAQAGDAEKGKKVFNKCKACHAVGEGAKNRVGPHLNDLFGRTAGAIEGYKYSNALLAAGDGGLQWNEQELTQFLVKPKDLVKGTKMAFAGLRKASDVSDIIAYLKTFDADASASAGGQATQAAAGGTTESGGDDTPKITFEASKGKFGLGRLATKDEVAAWDIDVRPDGKGLPAGRGTVAQGEPIYADQCAACHGDFGEAVDRWPVLAGGQDTLQDDRPVKTIGSYWPYLSTVYDYVKRAMPFGNARSLSDDEVYALTAYLLYLNDIVDDEEFELSSENFGEIEMPNAGSFIADGRNDESHYAEKKEPCMKDCKPGKAEVTMTARVLDVTPDSGEEVEGGGSID